MERGYIRSYRKKIFSDLWVNKNAFRVFEFLLHSATYKPHKYFAGGTCIELLPGQYISSERVIAKRCFISYQQSRSAIDYLKVTQRINTTPTQHYTLFSIVNWDIYQNIDDTYNAIFKTDDNAQITHEQRTDNAPITQKQEVKKLRSKEVDQNHIPSAAEIAAMKIVEYYEKEIRDERASRYRARKNVQALLKNGCTKEVLWECVNLYAGDADHKDPQFRKVAGNFFGRDAVYRNYIDEAKRIVEVEYAAKG